MADAPRRAGQTNPQARPDSRPSGSIPSRFIATAGSAPPLPDQNTSPPISAVFKSYVPPPQKPLPFNILSRLPSRQAPASRPGSIAPPQRQQRRTSSGFPVSRHASTTSTNSSFGSRDRSQLDPGQIWLNLPPPPPPAPTIEAGTATSIDDEFFDDDFDINDPSLLELIQASNSHAQTAEKWVNEPAGGAAAEELVSFFEPPREAQSVLPPHQEDGWALSNGLAGRDLGPSLLRSQQTPRTANDDVSAGRAMRHSAPVESKPPISGPTTAPPASCFVDVKQDAKAEIKAAPAQQPRRKSGLYIAAEDEVPLSPLHRRKVSKAKPAQMVKTKPVLAGAAAVRARSEEEFPLAELPAEVIESTIKAAQAEASNSGEENPAAAFEAASAWAEKPGRLPFEMDDGSDDLSGETTASASSSPSQASRHNFIQETEDELPMSDMEQSGISFDGSHVQSSWQKKRKLSADDVSTHKSLKPEQEPRTAGPKIETGVNGRRSSQSSEYTSESDLSARQSSPVETKKEKRATKVVMPMTVHRTEAMANKKTNIPSIFLSEEQRHVCDLVVQQGKGVFFTGSAGTGKSVLLREIISQLRKKHSKNTDRIAVTAATGLAACNIGGVTLHSFAGIGIGKEPAPQLVKKIRSNRKAKMRWMKTKVLIIDEISMVDATLFDKLEEVARVLRNNARPFGGIQLVITGDFFQLPPVPEKNKPANFSFDAGSWSGVIDHTIGLHHVFRQKDPMFANMLNEMREGRMSAQSVIRFSEMSRPLDFDDGILATELFPTRMEVERSNNARMQQLDGQLYSYEAVDGGAINEPEIRTKMLEGCMAPQLLQLKRGAQVMLIKNLDENLVNGSVGTVLGFMPRVLWDFSCERSINYDEKTGYPSLDQLIQLFTAGKPRKIALALETTLRDAESLPIVRFILSNGSQQVLLCTPETWNVELPNGEIQVYRRQVPLILAWAMSIHKAQGQTLERVKVDLGRVFERGQAYVALSRATSVSGLQVLRFDSRKVMAHDRVKQFYASLDRIEAKSKESESDDDGSDETDESDGFEAQSVQFGRPKTEGQKEAQRLKKNSVSSYFSVVR